MSNTAGTYTFALTVGVPPPGTSLNPKTGCITGFPSQAGTFCFTVTATDSLGATASVAACITIGNESVVITFFGYKIYPEIVCDSAVEEVPEGEPVKRAV